MKKKTRLSKFQLNKGAGMAFDISDFPKWK